jgi:hypothetical protein
MPKPTLYAIRAVAQRRREANTAAIVNGTATGMIITTV